MTPLKIVKTMSKFEQAENPKSHPKSIPEEEEESTNIP